jgi:hypothetical protein
MDARFKKMIRSLRKIDPEFMSRMKTTNINSTPNVVDVIPTTVIEEDGIDNKNVSHSSKLRSDHEKCGPVIVDNTTSTESNKKCRRENSTNEAQDIYIFANLLSTQML